LAQKWRQPCCGNRQPLCCPHEGLVATMLLYRNRSFVRLVVSAYGSVFIRIDTMGFALLIAAVTGFLEYLFDKDSEYAPKIPHHYGMHALGVIVGILLVFRTNLGWQRYWEAVGQIHTMYSKWGDAYTQAFAFASCSAESASQLQNHDADAKLRRLEGALERLMANFILLSAIASYRLTHGDTQRMDKRAQERPWSEQLVKREVLAREEVTSGSSLPCFVAQENFLGYTSSDAGPIASALQACPEMYGVPSEGSRSLLLSRQRTFARGATSLPTNNWEGAQYLVMRLPSGEEEEALLRCTDRAVLVMYWIIRELAALSKDLDAAPPIQSRMYQELSNGMLGFNQAVKLADVPLPFPYAQMVSWLLVGFCCFIPFYIVSFTSSMIVAPVMAFILFAGAYALNETAKELENPFGEDTNDITVVDFHVRFLDLVRDVHRGHMAKGPRHTPAGTDCS